VRILIIGAEVQGAVLFGTGLPMSRFAPRHLCLPEVYSPT
jgi:hypothetical protein